MANIIQCPIHGYFAAGFIVCPECASTPVTLQTSEPQAVTVVRGKKSRKRETGKPKAAKQKHVRPFTAKQVADMDNDMLQTILLDGRLYASLDFGNGYQDAVRRLVNAGYPVASYLWRVVSGKDT